MDTVISIFEVLQINKIFFVYFVFFAFLIIFVSKILMTPYFGQFLEREKQTQGQVQHSEKIRQEAALLRQEYEQKLSAYDKRFQEKLLEKKNEILAEYSGEIEKAQKRATEFIENSKKTFEKDFEIAQLELDKKALGLAQELALKIK